MTVQTKFPYFRLPALALAMYLLSSCGKNIYQGYVYDQETHLPIKGVLIKYNQQRVLSDEKGHFIINNTEGPSDGILFNKKGYKPDTTETIVIHAGEQMEKRFQDGRDTVFLSPIARVLPPQKNRADSSSANGKWPVSSAQFRKFYKKKADTDQYTLVVPAGFKLMTYDDEDVAVKESPYDYNIKRGDQYLTAMQFKQHGLNCKVIIYQLTGENDRPVLNIQLNSYNAKGQLQDVLLLDSRFTFEVVYYREFTIAKDGKITIKSYSKDLYTYNEQGDITGSIENPKAESTSTVYQLQPDGKFRKLEP